MFDDLQKKQNTKDENSHGSIQVGAIPQKEKPVKNIVQADQVKKSTNAEDIFNDLPIESQKMAISANQGKQKPTEFQPSQDSDMSGINIPEDTNNKKMIFVFFLSLILLAFLFFLVWFKFSDFLFDNNVVDGVTIEDNKDSVIESDVSIEPEKDDDVENNNQNDLNSDVNVDMDTDQDGLTDQEEEELQTDINSIDTDNDGLFDRDEVRVYKTDPLNPDTDGDGYIDGTEVSGGYNPLGEGKLYDLNQ